MDVVDRKDYVNDYKLDKAVKRKINNKKVIDLKNNRMPKKKRSRVVNRRNGKTTFSNLPKNWKGSKEKNGTSSRVKKSRRNLKKYSNISNIRSKS